MSIVSQGLTCALASYPFSICHLARWCLSGHPITKVHIGYFSAWGRRSSETLNTCHSQPCMRPILSSLLYCSNLCHLLLLFYSSLPLLISAFIIFSDRSGNLQTWDQPSRKSWAPRPYGEAHSLLSHLFSVTPPSAYALPPVECVEGLKQSWKVTLFDSAVSLNYVSAFISKSKYKS